MEVGDGVTNISLYRFGNRHCDGEHDPDCAVGYVETVGRRASDGRQTKGWESVSV